jgi:hypothetical protein
MKGSKSKPSSSLWVQLGLENEHGQHYTIISDTIGEADTDAKYDELNNRIYAAVELAGGHPKMSVRNQQNPCHIAMQCERTDETMMRRALQGILK